MRWTPQKWNDTFGIIIFLALLVFTAWLLLTGVDKDIITILIGAEIAWIGQIVSFYFRKAPSEPEPPTEPVPHG